MNSLTLPGFTAEFSFYKRNRQYQDSPPRNDATTSVIPQLSISQFPGLSDVDMGSEGCEKHCVKDCKYYDCDPNQIELCTPHLCRLQCYYICY